MKYLAFLIVIGILTLSCNRGKRYHDTNDFEIITNQENIEEVVLNDVRNFQKKINTEFKNPRVSPLLKKDKKKFKGLDFFPIDTTFRVVAEFIRTPNEKPFLMPTTTGVKSNEVKYGELHFTIQKQMYVLNVYQDLDLRSTKNYANDLFLPFRDLTNGTETYGGGRYLNLKIPSGNELIIDFNKAYNPYCTYNPNYSCPIVPFENSLDLAVKAGVKDFK